MSRSNYDKPFYVDVGTSIVAIRCASNRDVVFEYDFGKCPQVIQFTKDACDRMNKEAQIGRPLRNCDVGTAEEQYKRFMNMCNSKDVRQCTECSMRGFTPGCSRDRCFANWAQMPYEEGGDR